MQPGVCQVEKAPSGEFRWLYKRIEKRGFATSDTATAMIEICRVNMR